ncbi:MAG TPA: hypothetical protein VLA23_14060 [Candidatus Limnocylindrales bacterium]|nr:hypothetical protein [Candidatus Limnocylindrales bacterium]
MIHFIVELDTSAWRFITVPWGAPLGALLISAGTIVLIILRPRATA